MASQPREQVPGAAARFPVSFAVFAVARTHRALAAHLLRELGLFPGQEIMLLQLWDSDGQSQTSLGRTLGIDHSTVAKSVRRLEDAGLVTRTRSPQDRRVTLVHLTDRGRRLEKRVEEAWSALERETVKTLTTDEQATFVALARRIEAGLASGASADLPGASC
ncbi:MarR family transcriptional regulator [Amycolatopsis cynarae]|uniref:MarR family transcriptional regulator n=1 Tax=Amycolatopsis cynarae TaxID=2995223 RepID=A0ABY7BC44_9PSEU|nr:MarR family transcriptional regulator [Amycolatopsis sp. HUAS 11-8]WAL68812.1 MarR family transcriptional regulator [Amycolatopsis sp. HUAS 11-8]